MKLVWNCIGGDKNEEHDSESDTESEKGADKGPDEESKSIKLEGGQEENNN